MQSHHGYRPCLPGSSVMTGPGVTAASTERRGPRCLLSLPGATIQPPSGSTTKITGPVLPLCWCTAARRTGTDGKAAPSSLAGRTRSSGPTPKRSTRHCSTSSATRARPADGTSARKTHRRADAPADPAGDLVSPVRLRFRVARTGEQAPVTAAGPTRRSGRTRCLRCRRRSSSATCPAGRRGASGRPGSAAARSRRRRYR